MEIQQHDSVVVDVAGSQQGFAKLLREGEVLGREGAAPWIRCSALPLSQVLLLSRGAWRSPAGLPRSSITTTPLCCWISINLSFPLAGSRRRRRHCTVRVLNAEVPSVRHSVIGDLDHGEYDSINPVHWNASARDLQGYVDALPSLSLLVSP